MAKELTKTARKSLEHQSTSALKHAKKATKKHAAKKHAKKAAKYAGESQTELRHGGTQGGGVRTAFHHMQRASVVISLMEKGTGEDLRDLLKRGVKLYEHAVDGKGDEGTILRAIGVLRAAEHLSLAGLYAARHKHREKVEPPSGPWLESFMSETSERLTRVEGTERSKGPDLLPVAEELVRQAKDARKDTHLAYELMMAADALCFALENGL